MVDADDVGRMFGFMRPANGTVLRAKDFDLGTRIKVLPKTDGITLVSGGDVHYKETEDTAQRLMLMTNPAEDNAKKEPESVKVEPWRLATFQDSYEKDPIRFERRRSRIGQVVELNQSHIFLRKKEDPYKLPLGTILRIEQSESNSCLVRDNNGDAFHLSSSSFSKAFLPNESILGVPPEPKSFYLPYQKARITADQLTWEDDGYTQVLNKGDVVTILESREYTISVYHHRFETIQIDKRQIEPVTEQESTRSLAQLEKEIAKMANKIHFYENYIDFKRI